MQPSTSPNWPASSPLRLVDQPDAAQDSWPPQAASQRVHHLLAEHWVHTLGDPPEAADPGSDVAAWQAVTLPHTWNAEDTLDDEPGFYRGPGWYRRSLELDGDLARKRLFLYFEGAFQVADVYVDGVRVGGHVGGYTAFSMDVTDALHAHEPGGVATVAVRVDSRHDDDVPPYSGDWTFYGGLYRNVWLVATDEVHVDLLDHASPGVKVSTPSVDAERAQVRAEVRVANDSATVATPEVLVRVVDADGTEVVALASRVEVSPGEVVVLDETLTLPAPKLWTPESPSLYAARIEVLTDDGGHDRVEVPVGVRRVAVDAEAGFLLNGRPYPLRGTSRHQDIVGQGNAVRNAQHVADLRIIKAMGANVVRLAHYPHAPAVLQAADELGLAIWVESPMVNRATMTEAFTQNHLRNIRDLVRQHFNHPSIVVFGSMNEILLRRPEPEPEGYEAWITAMLARGEDLLRAEDPTRITGMVGHQAEAYNTSGMADLPMVWGWNLYPGWYGGTVDMFGPFLDADRAAHPGRVLWVTEFGADSDARLHRVQVDGQLDLAGFRAYMDQSIEYQQYFLEHYLRQIDERPWLAGITYWAQFDFGSEVRTGSVPHVNTKGLMLADRTPKPVFHLMQAWLGRDVLHIATRLWSRRAGIGPAGSSGYQPVEQPVTVYSSAQEVELLQRGRSLGVRATDSIGAARWVVPFEHGENVLAARATAPSGADLSDEASVHFTYHAPLLADPDVPFTRLALSAGAAVQYTDPDGMVWLEDRAYTPGAWGAVTDDFIAGYGWMKNDWVDGTDEDPLYQTYRKGMSAYRFDVPDGTYEVTLRFAEIASAGDTGGDGFAVPAPDGSVRVPVGWRVFDVAVNGTTVADALDLVAQVGQHRPHDVLATTTTSGGEGIQIAFRPRENAAAVSAIDVRRIDAT